MGCGGVEVRRTYLDRSIFQRDHGTYREGRRASAGRIDRDEKVLDVQSMVAIDPRELFRLAHLERLDVFVGIKLLRSIA
jgi:hypothetical protein